MSHFWHNRAQQATARDSNRQKESPTLTARDALDTLDFTATKKVAFERLFGLFFEIETVKQACRTSLNSMEARMATIRSRRSGNGKLKYQAIVRITGYAPVIQTFETKKEAERWAIKTEDEINNGRYAERIGASLHTTDELIDRYLASELGKRSGGDVRDRIRQLLWWKANLAGKKLA